ncbi:MAG: CBS domain-containing protein [Acidobacteria bacterium]|nr:CBS domain-containing protein [Acidobacteriota bacterium]
MTDSTKRGNQKTIAEYMTTNPTTMRPSQSLLEAALLMRSSGFRHIPIVSDGQLVGMLSDRDVARLTPSMLLPHSASEHNDVMEQTIIGKVMTREPATTAPDAKLAEVAEAFVVGKLGSMAVLEDGSLVGIITVRDMLRAFHDHLTQNAA